MTFPQVTSPPQAQAEVLVNENLTALDHQAVYAKAFLTTSGLTWGYYGGRWGGFSVAAGTLALTNAATNYVVVAIATGVISVSTSSTNWNDTTNYRRVYKLTTAGSVVTAIEDHRAGPGGVHGGGSANASIAVGLEYTASSTTTDSDPGTGTLRWNNATQASATTLYIDNTDAESTSLATLWASLQSGAFFTITSAANPDVWQLWKVNSAPINGTGYYKFPVTLQAQEGSNIANGDAILLDVDAAGGGSGSVTSVDASGGVQTASGSAITSTGTIRGAHVVNAQTGTSYAVVAGDRGKHVTFSNAASIAATIAQAGTTGFEDGYYTYLENLGVGAVTLTPTTSTVNGAATLVLTSGTAAILFSDGTNYRAFAINAPGLPVNAQTGTSYTYLSGDRNKLVTHTNAAAIAGTLPQATGAFGAGWSMWVQNRGAGTLTITPTTSTIDGAASLALTTGQGALIASDGTNYFTMRGVGGAASRSPSIQSVSSSATVTPTFSDDMVKITAQAAGLTLANPTGTAIDGLGIVIRIKDNGTARSISYGTQYRAIGITLPATTVIGKTTYLAMVFNNDDTKWDVVATGTEA